MTPDHAHHFFVLTILALVTVLLVTAMRTFAGARATGRSGIGREQATALSTLQADITEMKARLASVEHLLREVG